MSDFNSKLENQDLTPYLKKDAIVPIKIGTGFLQQIGAIIPILLENKSQEDVAKIEKLIQDKQELEPWMSAIATIQILVKTVFEEADKEGMVEYRSVDDVLKESLQEDGLISSKPESSPSDQSPQESE
jgi:hypothetical protein